MNHIDRVWPNDAAGKVPFWVYSDPDVYAAELERIWYGPHWLFCALEAEIPARSSPERAGDALASTVFRSSKL